MILKIFSVWLYAAFRSLGGRSDEQLKEYNVPFTGRVWKRWISPVYLSSTCIIFSLLDHHFHWLYLLSVPAFVAGAYSDGYGNDSGFWWREVWQRILSAFASTLPAFVFGISWLLLAQLILALVVKVTMNFVKVKAPIEEGIINFFDSVLKPFMV